MYKERGQGVVVVKVGPRAIAACRCLGCWPARPLPPIPSARHRPAQHMLQDILQTQKSACAHKGMWGGGRTEITRMGWLHCLRVARSQAACRVDGHVRTLEFGVLLLFVFWWKQRINRKRFELLRCVNLCTSKTKHEYILSV